MLILDRLMCKHGLRIRWGLGSSNHRLIDSMLIMDQLLCKHGRRIRRGLGSSNVADLVSIARLGRRNLGPP